MVAVVAALAALAAGVGGSTALAELAAAAFRGSTAAWPGRWGALASALVPATPVATVVVEVRARPVGGSMPTTAWVTLGAVEVAAGDRRAAGGATTKTTTTTSPDDSGAGPLPQQAVARPLLAVQKLPH